MPDRKPVQSSLAPDSRGYWTRGQARRSEAVENSAKIGPLTRRSFISMFLLGCSVTRTASFHRVREAAVEDSLRNELRDLTAYAPLRAPAKFFG